MEKFTKITGIPAPIDESNLDTDIIFPARFLLLLHKSGLGKHLFHERRFAKDGKTTDFILNLPPYDTSKILITGENFGCGSSREQAVWALVDFGIRCVIAPSFGEIFFANCFKSGVLPITLPKQDWSILMQNAHEKRELGIDLHTRHITYGSDQSIPFEIDEFRRNALLQGLDDIDEILTNDLEAIRSFEQSQIKSSPWIQLTNERIRTVFNKKDPE